MSETGKKKPARIQEVQETFQAVLELSNLLHTGLDAKSLSICIRLCEAGVNPEVLAVAVRELQKQTQIESATTKYGDESTKSENAGDKQ